MKLAISVALLLFAAVVVNAKIDTKTFSSKLIPEVIKSNANKNVIISPVSIYTCLALAAIGAEGKTAEEFQQTLQYTGNTKEKISQQLGELFQHIEHQAYDPDVELHLANRVYLDEKYQIADKYNELADKYFGAKAERVKFAETDKTTKIINDWVATNTNHKISNILTPGSLTANTAAVLVNAIYFKAHWLHSFSVDETTKQDFFVSKNEKTPVDMMYLEHDFEYADLTELDATAIKIPYANTDLYMIIMLPKQIDGLQDFEQKIVKADRQKLSTAFNKSAVKLSLPKFHFEFDIALNEVLDQLGLSAAFGSGADFGGLTATKSDVSLTKIQHKAFIDVNEFGTEAAGSTVIAMTPMAPMPVDPTIVYEFKVDHPFMFGISDGENLYFAGHMTQV